MTENQRISLSKTREKGKEQLGEYANSATHKLQKMIMFEMARKLNRCNCYRCNKPIESLREFSIDHKEPWLDKDNAKELFYDLDNIAFSHLKCNIKASRHVHGDRERKHPSRAAYMRGCRCDECKCLASAYYKQNKHKYIK